MPLKRLRQDPVIRAIVIDLILLGDVFAPR
jgi:hypothetical protein